MHTLSLTLIYLMSLNNFIEIIIMITIQYQKILLSMVLFSLFISMIII